MAATFKDFYREPSKPHQCMRESEIIPQGV